MKEFISTASRSHSRELSMPVQYRGVLGGFDRQTYAPGPSLSSLTMYGERSQSHEGTNSGCENSHLTRVSAAARHLREVFEFPGVQGPRHMRYQIQRTT